MLRGLSSIFSLCLLLAAGSAGIYLYYAHTATDRKIASLEQEKRDLQHQQEQLRQFVSRLTNEKRVVEVLVTDQKKNAAGRLQTTLLFVEYARDGKPLTPKSFTIDGKWAHFDTLVIEFNHDFIQKDDPLRGHAIALFTRIYGNDQTPNEGFKIDEPGKIPEYYRGADPRAGDFERELWANFWKLAEDPAYAKSKGIKVADGQSPWGPFEPGKLYTITLSATGKLSLTHQPLKPIYIEALKTRDMK